PDHLLPFSRRVPSFLFALIFRRHGFTKFEHHSHHIIGLNRFPAISTPYLNNRQQFLIKNLELQGVESKLIGASSVYIELSISRRLVSSSSRICDFRRLLFDDDELRDIESKFPDLPTISNLFD
ncbi:hypothetical protein LINGRAHAP2_LOCUS30833, partial [Linum grandiflorum]